MEFAIEVQKILLGDEKFVFRPIRLLKGKYEEKEDIFIDEFKNKYSNMNGNNPYEERYFCAKCKLIDLRQTYFDIKDDDEILEQFLEDSINIFYIGSYDLITGTIKTLEYNFADIDIEMANKEYNLDTSDAKENVMGFDFNENQRFIFDINSLNQLKECKSMDEIRKFIDDLIRTGEYIKNEINSADNKILSENREENNDMCNYQETEFNFEWEKITPYTILGIEEREYSKEELLGIVKNLIIAINTSGNNEMSIKKQTDDVLDAYNEIIKSYNSKQKTKNK